MNLPSERRVPAGGLTLSVREWGGGEPSLLCLHGLASNALWWDPVARRLTPRHRVVAVDLRGHGRSDRPEDGYGFPEVSADLVALAPALTLKDHLVVGHSWGASVALWLAAEDPPVRAVVCVDGGAVDLRQVFGNRWKEAEERMRPPRLSGLERGRLAAFISASGLADEVGEEEAVRILLGNFEDDPEGGLRPRLDLRRHMLIARSLYELDQPALLRRVRCPVLFVAALSKDGREEEKRAAVATARSRLQGPSEAVFLEGIHDLPVQRPTRVAAAIEAFLEELA